jgi:hypothetical protein
MTIHHDGDDVPYPTDEFGRPAGRDYHYRIPLNDDRAMRLATWALHEMVHYKDRFVVEWDGFAGDELAYIGLRTNDSKGHLRGLAEYTHSPRWEDVSDRSTTEVDRYRQNPSGGGAKIVGTFRCDPTGDGAYRTLEYETVVALTPTEFEAALEQRGDDWGEVRDAIRWAKDDAIEAYNEARAEFQRECDHGPTLDADDVTVFHSPDAVAFCERCEAELDADGDVVWG